MSRPVIESTKIVIKTEGGNRICLEGKGSATQGMLTAFYCLSATRREKLLTAMTKKHAEMLARESTHQPPDHAREEQP